MFEQTPAGLQAVHPDSVLAANLRACCEFRAGDAGAALHTLGSLPPEFTAPPAAEAGLGQLAAEQGGALRAAGAALIRHNAVVFSDGQGGLQVRGVPFADLAGWMAFSTQNNRRLAGLCLAGKTACQGCGLLGPSTAEPTCLLFAPHMHPAGAAATGGCG